MKNPEAPKRYPKIQLLELQQTLREPKGKEQLANFLVVCECCLGYGQAGSKFPYKLDGGDEMHQGEQFWFLRKKRDGKW